MKFELKWPVLLALFIIIVGVLLTCKYCKSDKADPPPKHKDDKKQVDSLPTIVHGTVTVTRAYVDSLNNAIAVRNDSINHMSADQKLLRQRLIAMEEKGFTIIPIEYTSDGAVDTNYSIYPDSTWYRLQQCDEYMRISKKDRAISDSTNEKLRHDNSDYQKEVKSWENAVDICVKATDKAVEKYDTLYADYQKLLPRNVVYVGLNTMVVKGAPFYVGGSVMLKTKGGLAVEGGVMLGGNNQKYYFGSVKYPLFGKR